MTPFFKWAVNVCLLLALICFGLMALGLFFNGNIPMACTYFVGALIAYWVIKWIDPNFTLKTQEQNEPSFEEFRAQLLHGPSSSLIPFHKAKEIAARFGDLIVELTDPDRFATSDIRNKKMHTLPEKRLGYSKDQVQIALAVVIAEMVVLMAAKSSEAHESYIRAAQTSSSELGRFYRQPEGWKNFSFECGESTRVYMAWTAKCERCWEKRITVQPALLREDPNTSLQWGLALVEYWKEIDLMIPELLKDPWLTHVQNA